MVTAVCGPRLVARCSRADVVLALARPGVSHPNVHRGTAQLRETQQSAEVPLQSYSPRSLSAPECRGNGSFSGAAGALKAQSSQRSVRRMPSERTVPAAIPEEISSSDDPTPPGPAQQQGNVSELLALEAQLQSLFESGKPAPRVRQITHTANGFSASS